jgi:hypothetical protein
VTLGVVSLGRVQANRKPSGRSATLQERKTTAPTLSDVRIPVAHAGKAASASRIAIAIRFNRPPAPALPRARMVPVSGSASGPVRSGKLNSAWSHASAPALTRHQSRHRATGPRSGLAFAWAISECASSRTKRRHAGRVPPLPDIGIGGSWPRSEPYRLRVGFLLPMTDCLPGS